MSVCRCRRSLASHAHRGKRQQGVECRHRVPVEFVENSRQANRRKHDTVQTKQFGNYNNVCDNILLQFVRLLCRGIYIL